MTDAGDDADETHVVTALLRHGGEILLLRRSDAVGTYPGVWGGVSGYAEGNPDEQVLVEIREETGLEAVADEISGDVAADQTSGDEAADQTSGDEAADATVGATDGPEVGAEARLVRSGRPVQVDDASLDRRWVVHPYLFECEGSDAVDDGPPEIELSEEHTTAEWAPPTAIATDDYETVPGLWTVYERVAPTVRSIAADDVHGAAHLSIRALEVLRDRAGLLLRERRGADAGGDDETEEPDAGTTDQLDASTADEEWDELAALARRLLEARPSMAVLRNRVNRAMAEVAGTDADGAEAAGTEGDRAADGDAGDAEAVLETTIAGVEQALAADAEAAERASEYADGRVLTLSRSGTVLAALQQGAPDRVFVAESRPAREGVGVAETLAGDCSVTVHTDAAAAHLLASEDLDAVLVGADAVLPDGRVVNKTGTRGVAIAAAREEVPVYAVAASDKVSTSEAVSLESGARSAVYDGDAEIDVVNPTFDVAPADCVSGIVTERGVLDPGAVETVADELRALADWGGE